MRVDATTEPRVEHISAERDPDLSTRTQQMRYLVAELGVTRPQAHALIRAYERDQERPAVTAGATYRLGFLDWLMREAPHGLKRARPVKKRDWRTTS